MPVAFFDDCLLKTGTVPSSELHTTAFILDMADVKVTVENLQPHVDAMHPNDKCALTAADIKQLLDVYQRQAELLRRIFTSWRGSKLISSFHESG